MLEGRERTAYSTKATGEPFLLYMRMRQKPGNERNMSRTSSSIVIAPRFATNSVEQGVVFTACPAALITRPFLHAGLQHSPLLCRGAPARWLCDSGVLVTGVVAVDRPGSMPSCA